MEKHEPARSITRRGQAPTKVIGRFPGEASCLTIVWAVLDLYITHPTNGIWFSQLDRERLKRLRYHANEQALPQEVNAA
jgi:hypothetical protein